MKSASKTRLCIPPFCSRELFWAPPALRLTPQDAQRRFPTVPRDSLLEEGTVIEVLSGPPGFGALKGEPR